MQFAQPLFVLVESLALVIDDDEQPNDGGDFDDIKRAEFAGVKKSLV